MINRKAYRANTGAPGLLAMLVVAAGMLAGPESQSGQAQPGASPGAGCGGRSEAALVTGKDQTAPPPLPFPAKGTPVLDPVHGTCMVRVTDSATEAGSPEFIRSDYSRRQAFNADNSLILVYSYGGDWHLYGGGPDAPYVRTLRGVRGDAEPQWHASNPDLLYHVPNNGGLELRELNVRTGAVRAVGEFGDRLPWKQTARVWTKSEGSPSADGRYWCFMAETRDFKSLGIFTWDMQTDTILGTYATGGNRPDHVSMSPSGRHCVVAWGAPEGVVAFSRDMQQQFQVHRRGEHSDIALDAEGRDVYVSIDYQSRAGDVFMVNLDTRERTTLFASYLNRTATALHFSGKAFQRPGWIVVSTYSGYHADSRPFTPEWLHDKVFAVELKADPELVMLAHTRRVRPKGWEVQDGGYWSEPQATASRDLTRVLFNSNWGRPAGSVETFQVTVPASALR